MRIFLVVILILYFTIACSKKNQMVIVELSAHSIKVEGSLVNDLLKSLNSLPQCGLAHIVVDRNTEHSKVVDVMKVVQESKCENISIQSI